MPAAKTFPIRAFQWDLARQVERLDVLIKQLPRYRAWGFQELYLHLEDAVEYPSFPSVARADAYTHDELRQLVNAARDVGIGVVPIANLLGHTQYLIKTPELRDLNEKRAKDGSPLPQGQICPLHPRTGEVATRILQDLRPFCTTGKIHVGLDESFQLGHCPRCRAEIAQHGLAYHFSEYVKRLHAIASSEDLQLGIWADMLYFIPEAIERLPPGIAAYDWYYYPFERSPRVEFFNFRAIDLRPALRARGIQYWGCPMNGAFRYEPLPIFHDRLANIRSWWERCRDDADGFLITSWEPYRLAFEIPSVIDAAAASLWLDRSPPKSDQARLQRGLERVYGGKEAARYARTLLAADKYPFSGYARWEENQRWTGLVGADLRRLTREVHHFERAVRQTRHAPPAIRASLQFRLYLAQRACWIARAATGIFTLRRASPKQFARQLQELRAQARAFRRQARAGAAAARAMWALSRDPRVEGQNQAIVQTDLERLTTWEVWLARVRDDREIVWAESPVCGAWQLVFDVINFAPAVQRVLIEAEETDGTWRELGGRYTIEFQACAARPRANIRRLFSLPLLRADARLRVRVRGVGEVKIANIRITNGVETRQHRKSALRLGTPAPRSGLPDPNQVSEPIVLTFH